MQNPLSNDERLILSDDIYASLGSKATLIDRDYEGNIFVFVESGQGSEVGIFRDAVFEKIHQFPFVIDSAQYDPYNHTFIFQSKQNKMYLATPQFDVVLEYTLEKKPI